MKYIKLHKDAKINHPAHEGDAGYDCFLIDDLYLQAHERKKVPLGLSLDVPRGWYCKIEAKSGLADKLGLTTIGNIIDSGYHGEIHAIVVNTSKTPIYLSKGAKICQLIFQCCETPTLVEVSSFENKTSRGGDGFGSTG